MGKTIQIILTYIYLIILISKIDLRSILNMQIKYWKNLQQPIDGMQKIAALAWSANSKRYAVATADRVIHLYNENGEK